MRTHRRRLATLLAGFAALVVAAPVGATAYADEHGDQSPRR